ncbi:hypothetical protein [Spiroplasma monobiae]|uniref:Transmembrane protein n=1 Tax=Spiroplasma monobiae MQ-1 TaxID=1336748 RepID=A0A2K9LWC7_SPISQ|nr:hypothetical protein [Spiroplasma monobiae]AUM62695.1 hypothetical protein SMONO_v1c04460 [Spiroplasma monobiae MQ-1]
MEANKIYQDSIFLLANLIKNEKLRVELLNDSELKKQVIELVNDLLLLEIDENCTFKDQKWGPVFGKALVNITKEKIKFIKPDGKKTDEVLSDITFLQTYCFNNLQISRDSLTDQSFELTDEFVKENSKITDELKQKYLKSTTSSKPEPEVVDKTKEKPNTQQTGFEGFAGAQSAQGNPFMGSVPPHPLQDVRFYPYNSKPKYTKWLKLSLGIALGVCAIMFVLISILLTTFRFFITKEMISVDNGWSTDFVSKWNEYLKDRAGVYWSLGNFLGIVTGGTNYIYLILIIAMMSWIIYTIVQPPKTYRQKFIIPGINLVIPVMFIFMMIFNLAKPLGFIFGSDVHSELLQRTFAVSVAGVQTQEALDNWISANNAGVNNLINIMSEGFNLLPIKILLWFFFISLIVASISIVAVLALNPKIDREKIAKANNEYQTMIAEAMQGRKYEIDPSIYEPQEEIDAFLKELKDRKDKKNKDKNHGDN